MNQNHGNLRNKPAFNALIPTSRTIPTLLRRGPYSGRLYQDMLEKILNNDRHDVILLDVNGHHLYRITHADWVSEDKYNRQMSKVLKINGLSVDAGGNLIKLSTPIESAKKIEGQEPNGEINTGEKIEGQEQSPAGDNNTGEKIEGQEQSPAGDTNSPENIENVNQPTGNQNKNYQNGKKNR